MQRILYKWSLKWVSWFRSENIDYIIRISHTRSTVSGHCFDRAVHHAGKDTDNQHSTGANSDKFLFIAGSPGGEASGPGLTLRQVRYLALNNYSVSLLRVKIWAESFGLDLRVPFWFLSFANMHFRDGSFCPCVRSVLRKLSPKPAMYCG